MMRSVYLTNESCGLVARQAASHSKVIFASLQMPEAEYAKFFTLVGLKRPAIAPVPATRMEPSPKAAADQ